MRLTTAEALSPPATEERSIGRERLRRVGRVLVYLALAYLLLFGIHAWLGRWTPEYLQGRDLWHFTVSRMVAPMVMLGVVAAFMRLVPAAILLGAILLFIGTLSAIKREATGEPFQVSDLFLAGQSMHLFGYVGWDKWLLGGLVIPASVHGFRNLHFRRWSIPLFVVCLGLLSTYRIEAVVKLIHANSYRIGVENLTFSQAESERMNGIATHLYFSTAGLRLKTYGAAEVKAALDGLDPGAPAAAGNLPAADIHVVLGEAWWRDPSNPVSPLDKLVAAGFSEGSAVSPVYGGTTPNAEFEVLTAVPMKSFQAGIIPYQHYLQYLSSQARSLPRLLEEQGYRSRAYHNFTPRFWLRDQVYPRLGFASFDSMNDMKVDMQPNGWPTDAGLYARALERLDDGGPQMNFLVTVQTHGPYKKDEQRDMINGVLHPGITDYHNRLSSAVDALLAYDRSLRQRGRPYVLLVFGDHLPGLRSHQWKLGMKSETDPRLHQVPFFVISSSGDSAMLRDTLDGRPLYCLAPSLVAGLRLGITDRYFRHAARACGETATPALLPAEAVIQNQLFADQPQP